MECKDCVHYGKGKCNITNEQTEPRDWCIEYDYNDIKERMEWYKKGTQ